MKCSGRILIYLLIGFGLIIRAKATVNDAESNAYNVIVSRNVFDLHAPPQQSSPEPSDPPPLNVRLTGISTVLGYKQAMFMVQDLIATGKPINKEESYILTEGQRQGSIQVLEINEKANFVKVNNDGKVSVLTFDPVKPVSAPSAVPPPLAGGHHRF
jgi:hypothetical protein